MIFDDPTLNARTRRRVAKYTKMLEAYRELAECRTAKSREFFKKKNQEILRLKDLSPGTVHSNTFLSNMSVQYANGDFIGEDLLPVVPVDKLSNTFLIYDKRSRLAYPDDHIGARSSANELTDARNTDTYNCKDYGYKEFINLQTLANQDAPFNEMVDVTMNLMEGIAFRRELRIAALLGTSTAYGSNTTSITAGNRWTDANSGGTIITDLQAARAALWNGRGPGKVVGFCSLDVWNAISNNTKIKDMFKYTNGDGLATTQMVAKFFRLEDILVGESRKDTANEGQSASYSRIWPDVFGMIRVADAPSLRNASFGYTMRFQGKVEITQWADPVVGTKGGIWTRAAVSEDNKVTAQDTGYLITNPIN